VRDQGTRDSHVTRKKLACSERGGKGFSTEYLFTEIDEKDRKLFIGEVR
jgi:hypothetical protein